MVCAAVGLASFIKDGFYSYGLCPVGLASFIKDGLDSYGLCRIIYQWGWHHLSKMDSTVMVCAQWGWHHLSKMDSTGVVCAAVGLASFIKDGFYRCGLCRSGVGIIYQRWILQLWSVPQWGWHHLSKMDSRVTVCAPVGLASFIKDGFYSYGLCPSGVGIIYQRWILQLWSVPSGVGIVHQRWIVRLWSVRQRGWHRSSKTKLLCEDGTSCDGMRGKRWGGGGQERRGLALWACLWLGVGVGGRTDVVKSLWVTNVLPGISKATAYSSLSSSWTSAGSNMLSVSSPVSMSSSELAWRVSSMGSLEVRFFLHKPIPSLIPSVCVARSAIKRWREFAEYHTGNRLRFCFRFLKV